MPNNEIDCKKLDEIREDLIDEEKQINTLKIVINCCRNNQKMSQMLWDSNELIFVILQNLTSSFYILNTPIFTLQDNAIENINTNTIENNKSITDNINNNNGELGNVNDVLKVKLSIDSLTVISQSIKIIDQFLEMEIDQYIYPFLYATITPILKESALLLFSSLLKDGFPEKMKICEILPLILRIIDSDHCQVLALQTLDLILNGIGLDFGVQTIDRFQAIDIVLTPHLKMAISNKNLTILKILLKIYGKLCEKSNVKMKLKEKIPEIIQSKEVMELCNLNEELNGLRIKISNQFQ
jgi:hypothetical protein